MKRSGMNPCNDVHRRTMHNTDIAISVDQASSDEALTRSLRGLHREAFPTADLWPGIAARLQARPLTRKGVRALSSGGKAQGAFHPDAASGPPPKAVPRRRARQVPFALAATMVLALGITGWWQAAGSSASVEQGVVQREAMGMTRQYQAALAEIDKVAGAGKPLALQPTFDELDRNARLILDAIDHDPDSRLLLQQLRRTYSRHLALAQRSLPS